jgi:predicted phosphodiesterase
LRYGLLADVHGNLPALEKALDVLGAMGVDGYLCAGDLVGYGPLPNECVELVGGLEGVSVAGNHDLIAVGRLDPGRLSPLAAASLAWTRDVLREDVRSYLTGLPSIADVGEIVVAHGSLEDPREYVARHGRARIELVQLAAVYPRARVLVLGHTHRPWACSDAKGVLRTPSNREVRVPAGGRVLVNGGSVGQSRRRRPLTRFGLLDLEQRSITLFASDYDVDACRRALASRGLPATSCHLRPSLSRTAITAAVELWDFTASRAPRFGGRTTSETS